MWILGVAFGRASAAWRPLAASRWLGAIPQPPWCRWGEGCGIAAPGYAPAVWVAGTCRRGRGSAGARKYGGPSGDARSVGRGRSYSSTGPPGHERASALGAAATRHELRRGPAPYAAVAFPGPRQVPIGSSMPVIYLHRAVITTHMFRPEQVRLPC